MSAVVPLIASRTDNPSGNELELLAGELRARGAGEVQLVEVPRVFKATHGTS